MDADDRDAREPLTPDAIPSSPVGVLGSLDAATFAGRVGEPFRIRINQATTLIAWLIEVAPGRDPAGGPAQTAGRAPFSVVFRSPPGPPLPQHIYRLQHDELGALDLFLVPIGPDEEGMRYEAVFS